MKNTYLLTHRILIHVLDRVSKELQKSKRPTCSSVAGPHGVGFSLYSDYVNWVSLKKVADDLTVNYQFVRLVSLSFVAVTHYEKLALVEFPMNEEKATERNIHIDHYYHEWF